MISIINTGYATYKAYYLSLNSTVQLLDGSTKSLNHDAYSCSLIVEKKLISSKAQGENMKMTYANDSQNLV